MKTFILHRTIFPVSINPFLRILQFALQKIPELPWNWIAFNNIGQQTAANGGRGNYAVSPGELETADGSRRACDDQDRDIRVQRFEPAAALGFWESGT